MTHRSNEPAPPGPCQTEGQHTNIRTDSIAGDAQPKDYEVLKMDARLKSGRFLRGVLGAIPPGHGTDPVGTWSPGVAMAQCHSSIMHRAGAYALKSQVGAFEEDRCFQAAMY